ncbi:MAG: PIG-L deacetylase family protein [Solirubrobacteraceae bacterium]
MTHGGLVAVVAHPDDEALIAGGTLALAARAGLPTGAVSLTRGELGPISDPALATRETLGDVRERELADAGAALGLGWTACLRVPDGELAWAEHDAVASALASLLAPQRPAALLTFGDDGLYGHLDHVAARRMAGLAAELVGKSGLRPLVYEAAWPVDIIPALVAAAREAGLPVDLWGVDPAAFGSDGAPATAVVDVRDVLGHKLAALRAHRTQLPPEHLLTALPDALAERFLGEEPWRLTGDRSEPDPLNAMLAGGTVG